MKSQFPGIASLAAQIEMFGLSKRELEKKFVRSELVMLAWRSQEISASFESIRPQVETGDKTKKKRYLDAQVPEGLPDKFYNDDGEIDLRKVTGEEAYKYMSSIGVKLPIMTGSRRE
jgi:hypothetical protein